MSLRIIVKETKRKLSTIKLDESSTIVQVKQSIVNKNKSVIIKNLYIKE